MKGSSLTQNTYLSGATSANIPPLPLGEGSVTGGSVRNLSTSWRKFIRKSGYQRKFKMIVTVVAAENTTVGGPIVLELAPTTEELLSGPLFQVAGMFEIDEPGWADKHDEYLAETYL